MNTTTDLYSIVLSLFLTPVWFGLTLPFQDLMLAGDRHNPIELPNSQLAWEFVPPNDGAPEEDLDDAASRPHCPASEKSFKVLVPATNFGLTVAAHPTFWLYVPALVSSSHRVEFLLRDEQTKEEVYRTEFPVTQGGGIVRFRLPEDVPPLEVGKKYRWRFDFFCNLESSSEFVSNNGVVLRQSRDSELDRQLDVATPQERVEIYAEKGVWHEMLTELVQLRCANSQDGELTAEWVTLLQHPVVRLDDWVWEPILPECTTENRE